MKHNLIFTLLTLTLLIGCSKKAGNTDSSESTARGIYGGVTISAKENPAVGAVIVNRHAGKQNLCSGSLIASNVVLTAAHCFEQPNEIENVLFSFDTKLSSRSILIRATYTIINPDYHPLTIDENPFYDVSADTALLKLNIKLQNIAPLKIVEDQPLIPNTGLAARIVGYGFNDTLLEEETINIELPGLGDLPIFKFKMTDIGEGIKRRGDVALTQIVGGVGKGNAKNPIVITPDEFFVSPVPNSTSQRSCHGDSGGPALINVKGKYEIVGITSGAGRYCALGTLGLYTNMVKYKNWAEEGTKFLNPIKGACSFEDVNFQTQDGGCKQLRQQLVWSFVRRNLMNKAQAKSYCDNLVEGGRDDWRLPNPSELQLLAAYGAAHLDISPTQISGTIWSTGPGPVNTATGRFYWTNLSSYHSVACVRK